MKIKVNTVKNGKQTTEEIEIEESSIIQNPEEDYLKYTKHAEYLSEISSLKEDLAMSDYKALKYAEGWISEEEYTDIKNERQNIRDRINELEKLCELNN